MTPTRTQPTSAIDKAHQALNRGDRADARRWAQIAVSQSPEKESSWLIMAAVSHPEASPHYLKRALEINPQSTRARKGMQWALQRLKNTAGSDTVPTRPRPKPSPIPIHDTAPSTPHPLPSTTPRTTYPANKWLTAPLTITILLLFFLLAAGLTASRGYAQVLSLSVDTMIRSLSNLEFHRPSSVLGANFGGQTSETPIPGSSQVSSWTEISAYTETPMQPEEPTPTFTNTPTITNTPIPTATFTPTLTATNTQPPPPPTKAPIVPPDSVSGNERWIDVDLSKQRIFAYEGDQLVQKFRVSTGTWRTPTVLGRYRIYVKYRSRSMSGPGYYLPNVPYIMYFYKGYGIHGTYWHNNFGTPMSHGCVNMRTDEAEWLFKWSSVGTLVNVHR